MPIYIAKDYNSAIESIVIARDENLANVFWQGQGIYPHSTRIIENDVLDNHPTGVVPVIKTKLKNTHHIKNEQIRIICKE